MIVEQATCSRRGPAAAASTPQQQTNRGNTVDTPEKSRLSQPLPRRRHRSHHHRCHRSLDATVILPGPPPRHPLFRRAQRNQPAPPSGAAAPTYHRSARDFCGNDDGGSDVGDAAMVAVVGSSPACPWFCLGLLIAAESKLWRRGPVVYDDWL